MILIAHLTSHNLLPSFEAALKAQYEYFSGAVKGAETIIITDKGFPIRAGIDMQVVPNLWRGDQFRISRARNACMDAAVARGADYLVLIGTDVIVTSLGTRLPETDFGLANIRFQKEGQPIGETSNNLMHSCCYVIGKQVLQRFRYCEDFVGYGWEDIDFEINVVRHAGIPLALCDVELLHLWHPPRDHSCMNDNTALFARRCASVRGLQLPQPAPAP